MLSIKDGVLEKTSDLTGTSYAAIYASAYISAIKDYAYKNNISITNSELKRLINNVDPYKQKEIITDIDKIFKK